MIFDLDRSTARAEVPLLVHNLPTWLGALRRPSQSIFLGARHGPRLEMQLNPRQHLWRSEQHGADQDQNGKDDLRFHVASAGEWSDDPRPLNSQRSILANRCTGSSISGSYCRTVDYPAVCRIGWLSSLNALAISFHNSPASLRMLCRLATLAFCSSRIEISCTW